MIYPVPKIPLSGGAVVVSQLYKKGKHFGVDFGWRSSPDYAVTVPFEGTLVYKGYNSARGYHAVFKTQDRLNCYIAIVEHLKSASMLTVGENYDQNALAGTMGNSGDSAGVHLHLELWKCEKGYEYNAADYPKYCVNPLEYFTVYPEQSLPEDNTLNKNVKKYIPCKAVKLTPPAGSILKIKGERIYRRFEPSVQNGELTTDGMWEKGEYPAEEIAENGYDWVKSNGRWCALIEGESELCEGDAPLPDDTSERLERLEYRVKRITDILSSAAEN